MSKFGEIIQSNIPILIDFYSGDQDESLVLQILNDVAGGIGNQARVIKVEVEKNETLIKALRVKYFPTYIIYKDGDMKWRQSGNLDAVELTRKLKEFV
jgi:thioredoxin 1